MVMEIIISVMLLVVGIAVLIIIHVCVVGMAFRGDPATTPPRLERFPSMKAEEIKKLPCFDYRVEERERESNEVECAVCLEIFRSGEKCRILPKCNHSFHAQCIDSWLLMTAACPICRAHATSSSSPSPSPSPSHQFGDHDAAAAQLQLKSIKLIPVTYEYSS